MDLGRIPERVSGNIGAQAHCQKIIEKAELLPALRSAHCHSMLAASLPWKLSRVQGSGLRTFELRVQGLGLRILDLRFMV